MTENDRAEIGKDIEAVRRVIDLVGPTGYDTKNLTVLLRTLNRTYDEQAGLDRARRAR